MPGADILKTQLINDFNIISRAVDRFRRLGYAYEYNGITVKEQIEFGWIKLKEK
jgi:hypothetical protein